MNGKGIIRRFLIAAGVIFFVLSNPLKSEDIDEKTRIAMTNFLYEVCECTMYFTIIGEGKGKNGTVLKKYKELGEEFGLATLRLSETVGMKREALMAIMEIYAKEMGDQIDNDGTNIAILVEKHGVFCKELAENPDERFLYWQNKS